jgi:hypothetical protein
MDKRDEVDIPAEALRINEEFFQQRKLEVEAGGWEPMRQYFFPMAHDAGEHARPAGGGRQVHHGKGKKGWAE